MVNEGRWDYGFHAILSQTFGENVLQSVRQNWLLCKIALKLHQPNMHIGYRVIPLSVHIVSLARSIFNGIWPTLLQNFICCRLFWRRVSFVKVSSLQPTCFRLWHMQRMRTPWRLLFPLLYSFKLAICYASCNEYFTKSGSFDVIMILCCDTTS